ncbi:plasmid recombination protein, partial [Vibrio lentus]
MSQVSLRIQKLKCSNISGAKKHNQREYKPDNAHTEKSVLNEVFIDSGNIDDLVFSRIRDQKALVIESGKNASTIAIEMVLSASPEYFRDDPLDTGVFDQKKMEVWRDANLVFLKNRYGDNLVR